MLRTRALSARRILRHPHPFIPASIRTISPETGMARRLQ
jgi:hypothetical protein